MNSKATQFTHEDNLKVRKNDMKILKSIPALWDDYEDEKDFEFLNDYDFSEVILPYLREQNTPCEARRLPTRHFNDKALPNPYTTPNTSLDEYYALMINDALDEMRNGMTTYLFSLEHVVDILRFEPSAHFEIMDGVIYANLPLGS